MDQLSKILSLAIGLIVVVTAFAVFSGRINLGGSFPKLFLNNTVKTTPTPSPTKTGFEAVFNNTDKQLTQATKVNKYNPNEVNTPNATSIPATGSPTIMISLAIGMFGLGSYLRKSK